MAGKKSNRWTGSCSKIAGIDKRSLSQKIHKALAKKFLRMIQHNRCARCGKFMAKDAETHFDHMTDWDRDDNPLQAYLNIDNIRLSHAECNLHHGRLKAVERRALSRQVKANKKSS